jgi:hypothetical protein
MLQWHNDDKIYHSTRHELSFYEGLIPKLKKINVLPLRVSPNTDSDFVYNGFISSAGLVTLHIAV